MNNNIKFFSIILLFTGILINYYYINLNYDLYKEFTLVFYITYISYYILEGILNQTDNSFRNIIPIHKKMYVVKNYIKSLFLAVLCLYLDKLTNILNDKIDLLFIKKCAIYYVMNDIIGLLIVEKLPFTTKIHHITTSLCALAVVMKKNNNLDIITLIVIYAIFSSMAFCVNFYLGLRVYSKNNELKRFLSKISFWIYLLCCLISWIFQIYLAKIVIPLVPIWHSLLYFCFLYSVCKDDIILMNWLYNDKK